MPSREEFIENMVNKSKIESMYSEPRFICPKCGGNVRQNLYNSIVLTCLPPIHQDLYECESCDYAEYIES